MPARDSQNAKSTSSHLVCGLQASWIDHIALAAARVGSAQDTTYGCWFTAGLGSTGQSSLQRRVSHMFVSIEPLGGRAHAPYSAVCITAVDRGK